MRGKFLRFYLHAFYLQLIYLKFIIFSFLDFIFIIHMPKYPLELNPINAFFLCVFWGGVALWLIEDITTLSAIGAFFPLALNR